MLINFQRRRIFSFSYSQFVIFGVDILLQKKDDYLCLLQIYELQSVQEFYFLEQCLKCCILKVDEKYLIFFCLFLRYYFVLLFMALFVILVFAIDKIIKNFFLNFYLLELWKLYFYQFQLEKLENIVVIYFR